MNTWIKRISHGILLLCMLVALLPMTARADNTVTQTKYGALSTTGYGAAVDYTLELDAPAKVRVTYANTSPYYTLFTLYEDGKHWLRDAERPISGPSHFYLDSYYVYATESVYQLDAGTYRITVYVENTNLHVYSEYALQVSMTVHEHSYTASTRKPTCSSEGYTKYTCDCGDSYKTNYKDKLPHTLEATSYIAPTCSKEGQKTDGKKCSVCGEVTKKPTTIPTLPHTEADVPGKEPTCTDTGITVGKKCTVCSQITLEQEVIPALGHTFEKRSCVRCKEIDNEGLIASGRYNDDLIWILDEAGNFEFIGTGSCYWDGVKWSEYDSQIKTVTIPDGITEVAPRAFADCVNLTDVWMADSVTNLPYAFENCTSLKNVKLSKNLEEVEGFKGCTSLKKIEIPDSVTEVAVAAFSGCTSLTDVKLPAGLTRIRFSVFQGCTALTQIDIPDSVTMIDDEAFSGCTGLTAVSLPEGLSKLGKEVFYNCTALQEITIPDTITEIPDYLFYGCTGLRKVNHSDQLTKIGEYAFHDCTSLDSFAFSKGLTSIGKKAFCNCDSLTQVKLPDGLISIGWAAFNACDGITQAVVPGTVTEMQSAFSGCKALEQITLADGLTTISASAFDDCIRITEVTIPNSVTEIGSGAFSGTGLIDVVVPNSVTQLPGAFSDCPNLVRIKLPDGMKELPGYFFRYCSSLASFEIPDSIQKIGTGAFYGCTALTDVGIPEGVATIEPHTFRECTALRSISMPSSLATVGDNAFYNCAALQDVYFGGTPEQWGSITIGKENDYLTKANVHFQGGGACGENLTWSLDKGVLTISGTGTMDSFGSTADIPWYADRLSVKKIILGDGVTNVSENAFSGITAIVNYPAESDIWTETARQNYGGNLTWIPLCETHNWGAWEIAQNPTCTAAGKKIRTCKREGCGETETELITATGHSHVPVVTAPTCAEGGYTTYTCTCGDSYVGDKTPPADHSYAYAVTAVPTTDVPGVLSGTCTGCRNTVAVSLPKLNQADYTYEVIKEATAEATGTGRYTWNVTDYGTFSFDVILEKIPEQPKVLIGDADGNGQITILDLMRLANYFAKGVEINKANADVNGDGQVTILDLMRLANYFAGNATLG